MRWPRRVCNTWEEPTINPNFDTVIIGAGMYGAYCVAKLSRGSEPLGLRILVVEVGGFLEHVQNLTQIGVDVPDPIFGKG
jgi:hypothetical protein